MSHDKALYKSTDTLLFFFVLPVSYVLNGKLPAINITGYYRLFKNTKAAPAGPGSRASKRFNALLSLKTAIPSCTS